MKTSETFIDDILGLEHFGVKGMKWGVRKDAKEEKKLAKADKKYEKTIEKANKGVVSPAFRNAVVSRLNERSRAMNDSDEYRNYDVRTATPAQKAKYQTDSNNLVVRSFEDAVREIYSTNPSGSKKAVYNSETDRIDLIDNTVKHADEAVPDVSVVLERDEKGKITAVNVVPLVVAHTMDAGGEFLEHFGVKGMKWGVRKDRSDPPGPASEVSVKARPGKRVQTSGGKGRMPSEDAVKAASTRQVAKKSTTDALSNAELQAVVTRMQLEANYKRLDAANKSAGRKFIDAMLKNPQQRKVAADAASQIHDVITAKSVGDTIKKTKL